MLIELTLAAPSALRLRSMPRLSGLASGSTHTSAADSRPCRMGYVCPSEAQHLTGPSIMAGAEAAMSALHIAALEGHSGLVEALLAAGALPLRRMQPCRVCMPPSLSLLQRATWSRTSMHS